jgi:hypothetical protein
MGRRQVALQRSKRGLERRIGMALFLLASGRIASAQDRWDLAMQGEIGIPQGYVQVRENEIQGTHLDATIDGSYFTQHEVSREDDNDIRLRRVGVGLALGTCF